MGSSGIPCSARLGWVQAVQGGHTAWVPKIEVGM